MTNLFVPASVEAWRAFSAEDADSAEQEMCSRASDTHERHGTFISLADPSARSTVAAPLFGVPFGVKDNIAVAGLPMTGGTESLRNEMSVVDAHVVATLKRAGAVMVGKTNLHELALGVTSENGSFGPVRNPVNSRFSAGGSSGGSAAAVASGSVPFSLGTDTGGSMTIPASYCGVVGMRPTLGRYSSHGLLSISPSRDAIGVMANNVRDLRIIDALITGDEAVGRPLRRIGIPHRGWWDEAAPDVRAICDRALEQLRRADFELVELDLVALLAEALERRHDVVGYEAPRTLARALAGMGSGGLSLEGVIEESKSPDVRSVLQGFVRNPVTEERYEETMAVYTRLEAEFLGRIADANIELLLYPSTLITASKLGAAHATIAGKDLPLFETATRNSEMASVLGHPMVSIPAGLSAQGLPVGLTVEGTRGADLDMLATAETISHLVRFADSPRSQDLIHATN